MALPTYRLELVSNQKITPKVHKLIFSFDAEDDFIYTPGQFVSFILPSDSDKPLKRSYSIANLETCSNPLDGVKTNFLEIVVAYVENGKATEIFFNATPGMQFEIAGPVGMLILPKLVPEELPQRIFLIGTGTGVAPYRSMLNQIKALANTEFHILFGAQYAEDLFYTEDFKAFTKLDNLKFHPCLSREEESTDDAFIGYVQSKLEVLKPNPQTDLVYLCGNPSMVDDVFALLKDKEFGVKQVKREKYVFSKY